MSKVLNNEELAKVVTRLLTTNAIKDRDKFADFMDGIATVVAEATGTLSGAVDDSFGKWMVGFRSPGPGPGADPLGILEGYDQEGEL